MAWRLQLEPARRRGVAVAVEPRAPPEGARAQLGTATDPAVSCCRAYRSLAAEIASSAQAESSPRRAPPTPARRCHRPAAIRFRRSCRVGAATLARRIGQCRAGAARSQLRPAPSRARLRARPRDAQPPARPAPRHPQRRLPQRAATGPAERGRPARMTPSHVRLKALRAWARRFASWDRHRLPTRDPDPVHPRPHTLPIGLSFAGCTGPLKKGTPAAQRATTCALVGPDMGTA